MDYYGIIQLLINTNWDNKSYIKVIELKNIT